MQEGGLLLVDLHTHILPNVDDGAKSFGDALEMVGLAQTSGTTDIVLTPHYLLHDERYKSLKKDEILYRFDTFKAAVAERYPEMRLYCGAEMFAVSNIEDVISDNGIITINNSRYLLTEFDFGDSLERCLKIVQKLTSAGYVPIIAHPERYDFIKEFPLDIKMFIEQGALVQINTTSILGGDGVKAQKTALRLLENKYADIVASDAHSPYHRIPDLEEAYSFVSSSFTRDYAERLFNLNPKAVIEDKAFSSD